MQMDFMKNERVMSVVDERARARKAAKVELKEIQDRQKIVEGANNEADEKRIQLLYEQLDLYRPDQPPRFEEDAFTLPLY